MKVWSRSPTGTFHGEGSVVSANANLGERSHTTSTFIVTGFGDDAGSDCSDGAAEERLQRHKMQSPHRTATPHRWGRASPPLPSLTAERDLYAKALDSVRQRKKASSCASSSSASPCPLPPGSPVPPGGGQKLYTRPGSTETTLFDREFYDTTRTPSPAAWSARGDKPKYLQMACLAPGTDRQWREELVRQQHSAEQMQMSRGGGSLSSRQGGLSRSHAPSSRGVSLAALGIPPIFEANVRIEVHFNDGRITVPANTWLVLVPPKEHFAYLHLTPDSQISEVMYLTPDQDNRIWLMQEAGGGCILAEGNARLLRQVVEERLQRKAAEANFRRATKGRCGLALQHATLILRYVEELECARDPHAAAFAAKEARTVNPLETRFVEHARAKTPPLEKLEDLARRTFPFMKEVHELTRELEANHLKSMGLHKQLLKTKVITPQSNRRAMMWVPPEPEEPPASWRYDPRKKQRLKGFYAHRHFTTFIIARFGNPLRAWFKLDPQENMTMGMCQFLRSCERICFYGNVASLWKYLDSDESGNVSILELHAPSAMLLARLKRIIKDKFDDDSAKAFRYIDDNGSNRVTRLEFIDVMQSFQFKGSASRLFHLLDRKGFGFFSSEDLAFFDKWELPHYIFLNRDEEGLENFKEAITEVHGNALKVWRRVLDKNGMMKMSWDDWVNVCAELRKNNVPALSLNTDQVAAVWRAMETDCSGWIALREWDTEAYDNIAIFKRWADEVHGGVLKAFRKLDGSSGNCKLSPSELRKALKGPNALKAEVRQLNYLFEGLDVHGVGLLTEAEVKFLEEWDLEWEDWISAYRYDESLMGVA
eukprot:TRINITY_DN15305_c0_g2_i1.p1 TRINITY_DN15305_c0_g2~~TRINITY_DN15305_c0_g2_i1.p1  ORF type:complete len:823 (-),score=213.23 TRINITY_DN15305_c0_g2_i1:64-2532(-)